MYEKLKQQVLEANRKIAENNLVVLTWGNASGIDRDLGVAAIKPSGVEYSSMTLDDIVVVDLDGNVVEGELNPSTDMPTHLYLYKAFPQIGGIVHTHSTFATAWAQMGMDIPCLGTTHADYFPGSVPVTRALREEEITGEYELNTGIAIEERFRDIDPAVMRAVLVKRHGVFTWGKDAGDALHMAVVLENVAKMALLAGPVGGCREPLGADMIKKHYDRKFGDNAYYGQKSR